MLTTLVYGRRVEEEEKVSVKEKERGYIYAESKEADSWRRIEKGDQVEQG